MTSLETKLKVPCARMVRVSCSSRIPMKVCVKAVCPLASAGTENLLPLLSVIEKLTMLTVGMTPAAENTQEFFLPVSTAEGPVMEVIGDHRRLICQNQTHIGMRRIGMIVDTDLCIGGMMFSLRTRWVSVCRSNCLNCIVDHRLCFENG